MEGTLVLGGYDTAKIYERRNHTSKITVRAMCPTGLIVTISKIILNFPNGSTPNLLDPLLGSSLIQACIYPHCPGMMSIPLSPYYKRFEAWTETVSINRSLGVNFFTMMYPSDNVY
jgi:hypothetical protein